MTDDLRARRERVVRDHMQSENVQDFDATIATFTHPHYELIATGDVYDGEAEVRRYYRDSRARVPDQSNEIIGLHHMADGVAADFWLRGTVDDRRFDCRMLALFLFEDGDDRIACERVFWDRETITRQLTREDQH